jgi:hypothetical protein
VNAPGRKAGAFTLFELLVIIATNYVAGGSEYDGSLWSNSIPSPIAVCPIGVAGTGPCQSRAKIKRYGEPTAQERATARKLFREEKIWKSNNTYTYDLPAKAAAASPC